MTPTVEVTASGRAYAVPDQVLVSLRVEAHDAAVGQALRSASEAVARLLGVLDEAGVGAADRRTTGLQVHPRWDAESNEHVGHTASYGLQLVVRDLEEAGRLVQTCADRSAGLAVEGFALSVRDSEPYRARARAEAVAACRRQAQQLADAAGAGLGALQVLTEGGSSRTTRRASGGAPMMEYQSGGMPVEAGEQEVVVTVSAVWALEV